MFVCLFLFYFYFFIYYFLFASYERDFFIQRIYNRIVYICLIFLLFVYIYKRMMLFCYGGIKNQFCTRSRTPLACGVFGNVMGLRKQSKEERLKTQSLLLDLNLLF